MPPNFDNVFQALKSQIFVDKFTETVQHTFLEYLASGFELNFMVAIDFTGMKLSLLCDKKRVRVCLKSH